MKHKSTRLGLAALLPLAVAGHAAAAITFNNNAAWDAGAVVNTGTPGDTYKVYPAGPTLVPPGVDAIIDYESERDVKNQRPLLQTFQVPQAVASLSVTDIFFQYNGASGAFDDVDLVIWELDDVFARGTPADDDIATVPPVGGTEFWRETVPLNGVPGDAGTNYTMQISGITGLTLPQNASAALPNAGYGFMLYNPDNDGVFPFKWAGERDNGKIDDIADGRLGPYPFGRPYSDNPGSWQEEHDLSLAITGRTKAVPDGGFTLLLLSGGLSTLAFLKRRFA